jgi:hypothetical protein
MEYIDLYNETLERMYSDKLIEETEEIKICKENDVNYTTAFTVVHIQCDLITYFKKYIFENVRYYLDQHTLNLGYQVPFDPKKTILVHLRLEDVHTSSADCLRDKLDGTATAAILSRHGLVRLI